MVWACFLNNKLGPITFINRACNRHVYISILEAKLVLFIQVLQGDRITDIVFQQDNAKVHTLKLTTLWLMDSATQNKFSTIKWLAYSPDMNPIEELWAHLKTELLSRDPRPERHMYLFSSAPFSSFPSYQLAITLRLRIPSQPA